MKGISSLLIVTLVVSAYGDSLENSEFETLEKLRQENALRKEKVLSLLRKLGEEQQTANKEYNQGSIHSKRREIENDDKNIEKWRPGNSPSILVSLIRKYKQNNGDDDCKRGQNKNRKKDDSDNSDNENSNVEDENESSIKNRHRRSNSREDSSDESNSDDDSSSDEELRRRHHGKDKPKENSDESNSDDSSKDSNEKNSRDSRKDKRKKNSGESDSDDKSDDSDSDEKNSRDSRKDKRKKKNSGESDSDDKSDDSDSDEKNSKDSRKDKRKKKNSDESDSDDRSDDSDSDEKNSRDSRKDKRKKKNSGESDSDDKSDDSDSDEKNSKDSRKDKRKKKNSGESNSDDRSDDSNSDEKNSRVSGKDKGKKKNSGESDSDDKSDDSDSNKSRKDKSDESKNSSEEKKWKWILNRGHHQGNEISEPWNWKPETNWELEAKRGELKGRLIAIVKIGRVIKLLQNRIDEFNKREQSERTVRLIRAIEAHKKLLAENIIAVSRLCNITEVQPNELSETIIKCAAKYSPRWRKLSNVGGPILENKEAVLKPLLKEFSAVHLHLSKPDVITHILNEKGLADKATVTESEQVNGVVSWQSRPDKSASPSDNTGAILEVVPLNSAKSSGNKNDGSGANVGESAASDKDQAPEPVPTSGKKDNEGNNLNDQPGSDSLVQTPKHIKIESSSAGDNDVNPSNNENEIPGSSDDQPGNDDNRPQQSVPKSDEPVVGSRNRSTKNLDLEPKVSSGSDNAGKVVATPDNNSLTSNKSANDINKLEDLNSDQIKVSIKSTELLANHAENSAPRNETDKGQNNKNSDRELGDSLADSNNQILIAADNQTSSGNNVVTDGTSSQTDSTTSQSEQTSEISKNTDTTEPRSTSELSTEETTDTTIFNTAAPESTSLINE